MFRVPGSLVVNKFYSYKITVLVLHLLGIFATLERGKSVVPDFQSWVSESLC